jgi:glycosyltransferase involved in cell wall biosynthesis
LGVLSLAKSKGVNLEVFDFTDDLGPYYLSSDIFCLPSRWEGFPNVVGEALAHGLPVVGFHECAGMKSLVENFKTGVLAQGNDDPDSLAFALEVALSSDWDRSYIRKSISEYSLESFADAWESTLFPGAKCE